MQRVSSKHEPVEEVIIVWLIFLNTSFNIQLLEGVHVAIFIFLLVVPIVQQDRNSNAST